MGATHLAHPHYANGQVPHATQEKGSFWFKDIMKYGDHFRGIVAATIGPGDTTLLWSDVWNSNFLEHKFPRLLRHKNKINKINKIKKQNKTK